MKLVAVGLSAAFLSALTVSGASALSFDAGAAPAHPAPTLVRGYGPLPYGLYGHRHRHYHSRANGTGYHGRGTRTGGPAGGLPGRS